MNSYNLMVDDPDDLSGLVDWLKTQPTAEILAVHPLIGVVCANLETATINKLPEGVDFELSCNSDI